jgi:hypothetical protein
MSESQAGTLEHEGASALGLMEQALELLDRCDGAIDVGAHLDLAICRLRDAINDAAATDSSAPWADPARETGRWRAR